MTRHQHYLKAALQGCIYTCQVSIVLLTVLLNYFCIYLSSSFPPFFYVFICLLFSLSLFFLVPSLFYSLSSSIFFPPFCFLAPPSFFLSLSVSFLPFLCYLSLLSFLPSVFTCLLSFLPHLSLLSIPTITQIMPIPLSHFLPQLRHPSLPPSLLSV